MRLGAAKDDFYEVRQRSDHRGVELISDALPFGRLWYPWQSHSLGFCSLGIGSKEAYDIRTLISKIQFCL